MAQCPFCESEIEEKYQFCPACDQRVRCENCGEYLLKGKNKCYVCGEPVQEEESGTMNTFELREERTEEGGSREVNIEISNEGMENAGKIVERLFAPGQQFDGTRKMGTEEDSKQPPPSLPPEQDVSTVEEEEVLDEEEPSTDEDDEDAFETVNITQDIDTRDIDNNYEMTIISLYDLTENGDYHHASPSEIYSHVRDIFKRVPFKESSNITYLSKYKGKYFVKDDDGGYYLSEEGLEKAEKIIPYNVE
jgi:hypothetical protein